MPPQHLSLPATWLLCLSGPISLCPWFPFMSFSRGGPRLFLISWILILMMLCTLLILNPYVSLIPETFLVLSGSQSPTSLKSPISLCFSLNVLSFALVFLWGHCFCCNLLKNQLLFLSLFSDNWHKIWVYVVLISSCYSRQSSSFLSKTFHVIIWISCHQIIIGS